ncbi:MAG: transglutaminase-like domain-containing protein [Cyanobacteria bacterium P01_H01_bin.121]
MLQSAARQRFIHAVERPESDLSLAEAALYVAQEDSGESGYSSFDAATYLQKLDAIAAEIEADLPSERYPLRVIQTLNQHLFKRLQFHGNTDDYYDPRNSWLNEVIDRRTGIPITLSLVYLEVAQRLDFPMVGIGMPGHFLIRPDCDAEMAIYVDPFHHGEILFQQDCESRLQEIYGQPVQLSEDLLQPVSKQQFLVRMLTNLKLIYLNRRELALALSVIDRILLLYPDALTERRDRGLLAYRLNQSTMAIADLTAYLEERPTAKDANLIRQLILELQMSLDSAS